MKIQMKQPTMKELIVFGCMALTGSILIGSFIGTDTMLMSFISTGLIDTALRVVILVGLTIVLVTRPPRAFNVRVVLGILSSLILIGAVAGMASFHIGMLDAVVYLLVSNILAIEAIEDKKAPVKFARASASN